MQRGFICPCGYVAVACLLSSIALAVGVSCWLTAVLAVCRHRVLVNWQSLLIE